VKVVSAIITVYRVLTSGGRRKQVLPFEFPDSIGIFSGKARWQTGSPKREFNAEVHHSLI